MRAARSTPLTRWVLLCALVFSVFGMHNVVGPADHAPHGVAAVGGPATDHTGDPAPSPHDGHDLLEHLCLAILAAAAGLALLLAVVRRRTEHQAPPTSRVLAGERARPPPPSAIRLATLCVLRQ